MFYQQPPVGRKIKLIKSEDDIENIFKPYWSSFYCSGTAALAAAIKVSIEYKDIQQPEIILPAYGCPDLISATVYAGAKPVLVDLEHQRPWMDLEQLSLKVCENTAAIVAVNLFGIKERMVPIREIVDKHNIILIEDSAQSFPIKQIANECEGDLVVLSFGRGKPVSLLGGGAVIVKNSALRKYFGRFQLAENSNIIERLKFIINANIYNALIHPRLYWIPSRLPFLHIGETTYKSLEGIGLMDQTRLSLLAGNIFSYQTEGMDKQKQLSEMLHNLEIPKHILYDLPRLCDMSINTKLLRYPIIVDKSFRDSLYEDLLQEGLGPSKMYKCAMNDIPGIERILIGQGEFTEAREFSKCIITLPIHNGITFENICNIKKTLLSLVR
jgi:dTDP-4-amino-4,6-dideoxygalactose transaminase